jgi:hypothetical protein
MNDYFIPTSLAPQNVSIDALENPKALDIDYDLK